MKKVFILLLAMLVLVTCSACNSNETLNTPEDITKKQVAEKAETVADEVNEIEEEVAEPKTEKKTDDKAGTDVTQNVKEETVEETDMTETANETYTQKVLIATSETKFNLNNANRQNNIELAANYINGIVLKQGEEFSFNNVVGRRTKERGFLAADIFSGNQVVQGIGGGICQTSTTLCMAVKQTDMKIVEQNPHSMRVSYAKYEDEAMINYGTSDFRFINTYNTPVTIEFSFSQDSGKETITCSIFKLE